MKNALYFLLILMIIPVTIWFLFPSFWTALIVIIFGIIIIQGIVIIENNPPHIGLITKWDQKIWKNNKPVIVEEGLNWVLLKGIIFNIIPINIELKQREFDPQEILTPDNVNEKVPISYGWNVDSTECHTYIDIGEEKGVDLAIKKILEGRLREYSRHPDEGPMTWKEMIASGLKTLDYLIKGLCKSEGKSIEESMNPNPDIKDGYDHLVKISDTLPTPLLLDWHRKKDPPNSVVRKQWGDGVDEKDTKYNEEEDKKKQKTLTFEEKWQILENKIKELAKFDPKKPEDEANKKKVADFKEKLEARIKNRIDFLEKLQLGKAKIKITSYGIYLTRLTVGDVNPFGDIYLAEIALQKEEKERKSETYEVETDLAKAVVLKKAIKKLHKKDADITECFNAIMKWKMIGSGKGFVYDGQLSTFAGIGDVISSIMKGGKK